jgi:uncharacterized protein (DUF302 family)
LLHDAEKILLEVAAQTTQLPLYLLIWQQVYEHTAYVHELVQRARAWQVETERLRQSDDDAPGTDGHTSTTRSYASARIT